ncbi:MAG TPA: MMPL family transporter, partial [Clostridia bacterium]|nr:MMPL family transporter [Clostridia bacterium]
SSGFTTMLGFIALMFMRFGLGRDLGIVIAKGIVFCLLSVFLLLPSLTVMTYRLIEKTQHKPFLPSFDALAKIVVRVMVPVTVLAALIIAPAFLAQSQNQFIYGTPENGDESNPLYKAEYEIEKLFGKANTAVLLVPANDRGQEKRLSEALYKIPQITSVISYSQTVGNSIPTEFLPEGTLTEMISNGFSRIVITADTRVECEESFQMVELIRQTAQKHYGKDYFFVGESVSIYDMKDTVTRDNAFVTTAGMIGIGLVILLAFRSVFIPVLLLLVIQSSIWINLSIPYFMGKEMEYMGYMIISSVQLGATVDYAILFTNLYIENRALTGKREALIKTIKDTAASILTSTGILAVSGLGIGFISTNHMVVEFGMLLGRGAALSAIMVLFFLPALIYMFDRLIPKSSLGIKFLT